MTRRRKIDDAELATILAALRYYQAAPFVGNRFMDIATNGGEVDPLDADAIDTLCEEINCGVVQL